MRYINCCKSTRKNKKYSERWKTFFLSNVDLPKKKCIKGPVKGFTMRVFLCSIQIL